MGISATIQLKHKGDNKMDKLRLMRFIEVASNDEVRFLAKNMANEMQQQDIDALDRLFNFQISLKEFNDSAKQILQAPPPQPPTRGQVKQNLYE